MGEISASEAVEYFESQYRIWLDRAGPHRSTSWDREGCLRQAAIYRLAIDTIAQRMFVAEVTSHMREEPDPPC